MEEKKWVVDKETAMAMNAVAEELGIKPSQVREIVTSHYLNTKKAFTSDKAPIVLLPGIGFLKAVPKFIKSGISKNTKRNNNEEDERLTAILDRRKKKKKQKKKEKKKKNGSN